MKSLFILCVQFVGIFCVPMLEIELDQSWNLFKQVYDKQYVSFEEETTRLVTIEIILLMDV